MNSREGLQQHIPNNVNYSNPPPIAVIGIGCRLPGGIDDARSYWTFLHEKRCGISEVPADRWNLEAFFDPDPEATSKARSKWGGFLQDDVFGFDPAFFDMSPREVMLMDPQQRLLLQVTYETIQDAGTTANALQRLRTGVFVGISTSDFGHSQKHRSRSAGIFAGTGSAMSIAANRISHRFDFTGPSLAIDTACSSALVAVDQAVRHLRTDTCDVAFAGGVNCMLDPETFIAFSSANMLSPTGAIYTFDERADGFVRAEGCGLVLLKPLSKAVRDGNRIYAVIRDSAVNQDGRTQTLTAPNDAAQTSMLVQLVAKSGTDPQDVGFVEAHGTGTQVGDPIEASAIGRVFGILRTKGPLPVGSFKPNLGHLESASGIAGLIKAVLSVHHGIALPNRNFSVPNPNIPFDALGIRVPTEPEPFEEVAGARFAVVNSFGFGGTNASALIENWSASTRPSIARKGSQSHVEPVLVPISSGSKAGLKAWAMQIADAIDTGGSLERVDYDQIASHLRAHRDHFSERAAVIADPKQRDLSIKLRAYARGEEPIAGDKGPAIIAGRAAKKRKLAFTFSGQGGQWWGMSRALLQQNTLYRRVIDHYDEAFSAVSGWSVVTEMLKSQEGSRINDPDTTQAAIFANQIGLYALWTAHGLEPELLIGHSFGEVAATYLSGAIDLETAVRIIYQRGFIPDHSTRRGAMAAIGLTVDQLLPLLPGDETVVIAAYNGPTAQTISGMEDAVLSVLAKVAEKFPDALARRHTMNFGWHSAHLEDCKAWFQSAVGEIEWKVPRIPIVSTVTGIFETRFDAEYWWQNLRQPVSLKKAIDLCIDVGFDAFLELGPHRTITPLIHGIAQERNASVLAVSSLDRSADDFWTMARSLGALYVAGTPFKWLAEHSQPSIPFPKAPWVNERLVQHSLESKRALFGKPTHPLLGWRELSPEPTWTNEISIKDFKYLSDHRVSGDCLFPAVGYVEMMVAALRDHFGPGQVELRDVKILEALSIGDEDSIILRTTFDPVSNRIRVSSLRRDADTEWRLRCQAYGWRHEFSLEATNFNAALLETPAAMERDEFYKLMSLHGLDYGPRFRGVQRLWLASDEHVVAQIEMPDANTKPGFIAFPGLLDSVLQSGLSLADYHECLWKPGTLVSDDRQQSAEFHLRLPIGIRKIMIAGALPSMVVAEFRACRTSSSGSYRVYTPDGMPLVAIENLYTKTLRRGPHRSWSSASAVIEERFVPLVTSEQGGTSAGQWLLIASELTNCLVAALEGRGASVAMFDPSPLANMNIDLCLAAIQEAAGTPGGLAGIVYGPGPLTEAATPESCAFQAAVERSTVSLIALGQVLDRLRAERIRPELIVLTRGARRLSGDGPMTLTGLADSALIGLTRTIANECEEFSIRQIDADAAACAEPDVLAAMILQRSPETEVVLRGSAAYAPRLEQKQIESIAVGKRRLSRADETSNYKVTMTSPGIIDNIVLRETEMPQPGLGDVVVEVAAVGLNFRDVMVATGILPDEVEGEDAWWRNLGLEFAGTVKALGQDVENLKIGDRVAGMGKGFLRRYARAPAAKTIRIPDRMELVAAATIPAAFMTAHYSLHHVARLAKGETVLIHLATGGVGLAAIQVARHLGAEVFATAGSVHKREYLRTLGIQHVMNSRSLDFAEEVRAKTDGRGVDVVLNALSGPGIDKGLECLAPFGRFVEIGKRDLADDKPIGLRSLYCNNSYSVIDLSTLGAERPELLERLLIEVADRVAEGIYRPLALTTFSVPRVAEAMRHLAKAQHIGKVVVTLGEPEVEVELDSAQPLALASTKSYLVTGGLRGFGATVADWLSRRGAGRLLLAGRSGVVDPTAEPVIQAIKLRGTEVVPIALDITDRAAVTDFVRKHVHSDKPLSGIIHGAAVIADGMLSQLDRTKITSVLYPKVAGAWNLHCALLETEAEVEFFVSFSSLAQVLGSRGQANYTAANSFLKAFASYRRSRGMTASTVDWGVIGGSGFVARSTALSSYLDSIGMKTVADVDAANALDRLLRADSDSLTFAHVDWSTVKRVMPGAAANPRIKPLFADGPSGRSQIRLDLATTPRAGWESIIAELIRTEVAKVLKVNTSDIAPDRKLSELGLDSLSSFELKNRIEAQVDINLPVAKFLQTPTVNGLSAVIANAFESSLKAQAAASAAALSGPGKQPEDDGRRLRPIVRQIVVSMLHERPMTSEIACRECAVSADLPYDVESPSFEGIAVALSQLSQAQEALCLSMVRSSDGQFELKLGNAPSLERIVTGDDLRPVTPDRPWRFGAATDPDGRLRMYARAHCVAADPLSPSLALMQLASAAKIGAVPRPEIGFRQHFGALAADLARKQAGHLAFWRELLRSAPPILAQPQRSRAAAPAGLGTNRGPVGYLEATTSTGLSDLQPDRQEEVLLAAYFSALARVHRASNLVVERFDEARRDTGPADLVGPIADSLPLILDQVVPLAGGLLERIRRQLASARCHRAMDTAAIEANMELELRESKTALHQFGFWFVDQGSATRIRALGLADPLAHLSRSSNEVRLDIEAQDQGLRARLGIDTDVVDRAYADALMTAFFEALNAYRACDPLQLSIQPGMRWHAPQLPLPAQPSLEAAKLIVPAAPESTIRSREVPISSLQRSLLEGLLRPDATSAYRSYWSAGRAFRIRPSIDVQRLQRAIGQLTERHEALRTRFVVENRDVVRAFVDHDATPKFFIEDLAEQSERKILNRVHALADDPIDPFCDPLFQVHLIRCGGDGDIVIAKGHHVVGDGWSFNVLLEETFQAYLGIPLEPIDVRTEDYVQWIDRSDEPDFPTRRDAYLRALYSAPVPSLPNLGRVRRGLPPNLNQVCSGGAQELVSFCTPDQEYSLRERARLAGLSETSLLIAAYSQTLAGRGGVDEIIVTVPIAMRADRRLSKFVGYLAGLGFLRASPKALPSLESLAADLSRQLSHCMELAPFNHVLQKGKLREEIIGTGSYLALYCTGMQTADRLASDAVSAPMQRLGGTEELDFGLVKITPLEGDRIVHRNAGVFELDMRSFQSPRGLAYRCAYDVVAFDAYEAQDIFSETLERLGMKSASMKTAG